MEVCSLPSKTSTGGQHKWGERGMLNFSYTLFLCSFLFPLMFQITLLQDGVPIECSIWIKTPTSIKVHPNFPSQNLLAAISNHAPFVMMPDLPCSISEVIACTSGSTLTLLHTSVSKVHVAVMSSISLRHIMGNPIQGQDNACSTVKLDIQIQLFGILDGVQLYLNATASTKVLLCKENLVLLLAVWSASLKTLSYLQVPQHSEGNEPSHFSDYQLLTLLALLSFTLLLFLQLLSYPSLYFCVCSHVINEGLVGIGGLIGLHQLLQRYSDLHGGVKSQGHLALLVAIISLFSPSLGIGQPVKLVIRSFLTM